LNEAGGYPTNNFSKGVFRSVSITICSGGYHRASRTKEHGKY